MFEAKNSWEKNMKIECIANEETVTDANLEQTLGIVVGPWMSNFAIKISRQQK